MRESSPFKLLAIFFFLISAIAAIAGFFLIVGMVAVIAKMLFLLFGILFLTFAARHYLHYHR